MPPLGLKKVVPVELRSVGLDERCSMENPALATTESTSGSASSTSTKACCSSISSLPCALILLDNLAEILTYRFCQERYREDFAFVQAFPPESLGLRCPIRIPSCLMAFRRMEAVLGSFGAQRQKVPLGTLLEAQPHSSGWVPIIQLLLK
jgi:hypothetical protein